MTILHSFCLQANCLDGTSDFAGLVQDTNGNFYGTTELGGAHNGGTIFKITSAGEFTTLYGFCSLANCADGKTPGPGSLVQATNGGLYGTTPYGGPNGGGTLFKISAAGKLTTIHSFCMMPANNCEDGGIPTPGLIQATNGNFYGNTYSGGAYNSGTIFEITPAGKFTVIYSFCAVNGCPDGANPIGGLLQATDGNLYGTTSTGGSAGYGTIFRISPSGVLATKHSFNKTDGASPYAAMIQASDGNLYGTTNNGGAHSGGTLFKMALNGTLTTLYNFCSQPKCTDGQTPFSALVQDTSGKFYGTTELGGSDDTCYYLGCGTVFSLDVGLRPFVQTRPTSGKVGTKVIILGTDLTCTTSVSFDGTVAAFTVVSASEITAKVPTGASTGIIKVTTPTKTLSTRIPFLVIPQVLSFIPTSGPAGTMVTITGVSFTGTTEVTFGGISATSFTVNSDTEVTAIVPAGAKTGKIAIATPGGTATSASKFTVT